ncbi:hypothetical protein INT47_011136 [Mucor saturninus]|uniref:Uncharacterized protein n=1 Tax=Mucor saturninus TaxID=64648 RepID=A0A8H7RG29_9FUNG|nr:hypothetical protein INT47_011136 [Mucor saturninus]
MSFNNVHDASLDYGEKQMKRFSGSMSLRHRASSASLYQQMTSQEKPHHQEQQQQQQQQQQQKQQKRGSYMKPFRRIDPEESNGNKMNENTANLTTPCDQKIASPTRISTIDIGRKMSTRKAAVESTPSRLTPTRLSRTKSNQSIMSINNKSPEKTSKLRQPSPAATHAKLLTRSESNSSISSTSRKKSSKSQSSDDDSKSCMTRTSSNGSTRRKSSLEKRKLPPADFAIDMLKDELEKEKASVRSLQGQKEAIAKDLDYFCSLVDQITEEKDEFKRKYEQEKLKNEELKKSFGTIGAVSPKGESRLKLELENAQQQNTENQYIYYNNIQIKNDENNKLRYDLKQATRQIQVLRKTMEQMLRADGKDFDDDFFDGGGESRKSDGEKYLLLQTGYHPESPSNTTRPTTNPPSPTPCYSNTTMTEERYALSHDEDEDILSVTSRDSGHSSYHALRNQQYDFLKYDVKEDDPNTSMAKRKSADISKKIALSRRRKDQLEEMLGEVDSQLNKVKQKIRPC